MEHGASGCLSDVISEVMQPNKSTVRTLQVLQRTMIRYFRKKVRQSGGKHKIMKSQGQEQ